MAATDESMFWELIEELQLDDPRVFKEWISIPQRDRSRRHSLLREGVTFVASSRP